MDLRTRTISSEQLAQLKRFIAERRLGHQPFIFRDDLEVGAGQHFSEHLRHYRCVHDPSAGPALADLVTTCPDVFRESNAQLRRIYELFLGFIREQIPDLSSCSFAEVGCNSGYFLYGLALRGARRCVGLDVAPNDDLFAVFNDILGTRCEFRFAEWDSLRHDFNYGTMPQVDVGLSIAVSCHLADPLHHLAHLCDHSNKAVFLYCPATEGPNLSITFGEPGRYVKELSWPVAFDSEVRPSARLLRLGLEKVGFEDIRELYCPDWLPPAWQAWFRHQKAYLAFRTADVRSALSPGGGKSRRDVPPELLARLHASPDRPGRTGIWERGLRRLGSLVRRSLASSRS
jgi:hypothetical protein